MTEHDEHAASLRAVQRSQKLATTGIILGILPPLLALSLYFSYQQWIEPILPSWSECQSFTCTPLGFIFVFGPGILAACGAIVCGYSGILHWPRHHTEKLMLFNMSLALGAFWLVMFVGMMMTGIDLVTG